MQPAAIEGILGADAGLGGIRKQMVGETDGNLDTELQRKLERCQAILKSLESVVVAFSAGVDSTFLLALAAKTLGPANVLAAMGISGSLAARERDSGRRLVKQIGTDLVEIETGEMADSNYSANPPDRCFYCKQDLFTRLNELAAQRNFGAVVSGANADDAGDFRPGMKAAKQLGVRSPLLEAGLTKDDVRAASRDIGLPTWNKPAMACLASRFPYGSVITPEKLLRVEKAEYVLKDLGFENCRVRHYGPLARIEVPSDRADEVLALREQIVGELKRLGYTYVSLDLEGLRSGSMNEVLEEPTIRSEGGQA